MRLYPLCLPLLLTGCSQPVRELVILPPNVPPDLLQPCAGYTGPLPHSEGQISDALIAEARGRSCANGRLTAVADILTQPILKD